MKITALFIAAIIFASCSQKKKYCVLKMNFICTPDIYFDSLDHVILSNDYADLNGKISSFSFFSPVTVYQKGLKRKKNEPFYLNNVEKDEYAYLFVEGKSANTSFSGITRGLNFSNRKGDTVETEICVSPNMQLLPN